MSSCSWHPVVWRMGCCIQGFWSSVSTREPSLSKSTGWDSGGERRWLASVLCRRRLSLTPKWICNRWIAVIVGLGHHRAVYRIDSFDCTECPILSNNALESNPDRNITSAHAWRDRLVLQGSILDKDGILAQLGCWRPCSARFADDRCPCAVEWLRDRDRNRLCNLWSTTDWWSAMISRRKERLRRPRCGSSKRGDDVHARQSSSSRGRDWRRGDVRWHHKWIVFPVHSLLHLPNHEHAQTKDCYAMLKDPNAPSVSKQWSIERWQWCNHWWKEHDERSWWKWRLTDCRARRDCVAKKRESRPSTARSWSRDLHRFDGALRRHSDGWACSSNAWLSDRYWVFWSHATRPSWAKPLDTSVQWPDEPCHECCNRHRLVSVWKRTLTY